MKSKELRWAAGLATAGVLAGAALVWLPRASDDPDASVVEAGLPGAVVGDLRAAFEDRQMPSLSGNWTLSLPEDHAPHPEAPAETWAIFAHLRDADGAPVSALFTLSRFGIATEPDDTGNAWAPRDAWLGQAAIVGDRAQAEERLSRGAGAAGQDAGAGRVWLDDWSIDHRHEAGSDRVTLRARVEGTALELTLVPVKDALGPEGGVEGPSRGFAMTRLDASGEMGPDGTAVDGVAWMDRLWGDLPAPGGPLVYDRVILHLDDGADVSLLRTRRRDGRGGTTLDGVLVDATGTAVSLTDAASWQDGDGADVWTLTGPDLSLDLTALPGGGVRDFAAPVRHAGLRVEGTRGGRAVGGSGSLLLSTEVAP